MAQFYEGQTATNPQTKQKIEYRKGRWVPISAPQASGGVDPNVFRRARDSVQAIDDATKRTNFFRTGWVGGVTAGIPGTPAFNLDRDLDTLKARTAFDELAAMRKASPTGGALGAISDKELQLLQASEANLDVGQGEAQIDRNLGRMRSTIAARTPGVSPENPIDLTAENQASIPDGAYFRVNGQVYRNKRGAGPAKPRAQGGAKPSGGYKILSVE